MTNAEMQQRKKEIGKLIKARRIAIGYNQSELAKLIGMTDKSRTRITDIEAGRKTLTLRYIRSAAQILGLPIDRLIP